MRMMITDIYIVIFNQTVSTECTNQDPLAYHPWSAATSGVGTATFQSSLRNTPTTRQVSSNPVLLSATSVMPHGLGQSDVKFPMCGMSTPEVAGKVFQTLGGLFLFS